VAKCYCSWHQAGNLRVGGSNLLTYRKPMTLGCLNNKYSQTKCAFNEAICKVKVKKISQWDPRQTPCRICHCMDRPSWLEIYSTKF